MANGKFSANLAAQARDPKTRFLSIVAVVIAGGCLVVSYYTLSDHAEVQTSASLSGTPEVESIPGELGSPFYESILSDFNQRESQRALETGQAFVPVLQGQLQIDTDLTLPLPPAPLPQVAVSQPETPDDPPVPPRTILELPAAPEPIPVPVVAPAPPPPMPQPLWIQADQGLANSMQSQIGGLVGGWRPQASESVIFYVPGNPAAGQTTGLPNSPQVGSIIAPPENEPDAPAVEMVQLVKPGQIIFARLITRAVSTKPGPVLAEIVGGKLNRSRLLGTFGQRDDVITLEFNTLVYPDGRSTGISAAAVDPADGTTGLATSVDRFFFERFVVAAAAAFISDFAEAASEPESNTTITIGVGGTTTNEQQDERSTEESVLAGVSAAADVVTNEIERQGDKYSQPEVTIAQGTLFGLLFMEELVGEPLR
jgi:hypothetical protein